MNGTGLGAAKPPGFKYGEAEHILGGAGEGDILQLRIGYVLVGEYAAVYE